MIRTPLLALATLAAATLLTAQPAQCLTCGIHPCYGPNACGPNCVCIIPAGETQGTCASIQ